MTFKKKLCLCK